MKNNVAVFILIILVASSFKYRSKTAGSALPSGQENPTLDVLSMTENAPTSEFKTVIDQMQNANQQLANGNPEPIKDLWSHANEVTIFCGSSGVEVRGWKAVEERLDWICSQISPKSNYTFEKISAQAGEDFGSVQQTEHYRSQDGKSIDLGVTILFKREANGWKIIHRHAANLSPRIASM